MNRTLTTLLIILFLVPLSPARADDGYRLWLGYKPVTDRAALEKYRQRFGNVMITGDSPVMKSARDEFIAGLTELTGLKVREVNSPEGRGIVVAGTFSSSPFVASLLSDVNPGTTGEEGYIIRGIRQGRKNITVV
ncbi:MAG TPA: alpha-glucuronidase family glycosyl hydrolase, partial [Bacteroidales bacterium]|nr:alpha-glucuronidase family glycosyl hydrolase [Bacteroidales bacterium]